MAQKLISDENIHGCSLNEVSIIIKLLWKRSNSQTLDSTNSFSLKWRRGDDEPVGGITESCNSAETSCPIHPADYLFLRSEVISISQCKAHSLFEKYWDISTTPSKTNKTFQKNSKLKEKLIPAYERISHIQQNMLQHHRMVLILFLHNTLVCLTTKLWERLTTRYYALLFFSLYKNKNFKLCILIWHSIMYVNMSLQCN